MKKLIGIVIFIGLFGLSLVEAKYYSFWDFLWLYFNTIIQEIPASYKYINVLYDIPQTGSLFEWLQKAIYTESFPNIKTTLPIQYSITQETAAKFIKENLWLSVEYEKWKSYIDQNKMISIIKEIKKFQDKKNKENNSIINETKLNIIKNIYNRLNNEFLYENNLDKDKLEYWAIQWFVDAANDEYTKYFPPTEAKSFNDDLKWEITWIGAYLEMKQAGVVIIASVINWYSAEKAWLKAKDQITKVNNTTINESMSVTDVSSLIKWPKWTTVNITIKRDNNELNFTLERVLVKIENIKSEILSNNICYVDIREFSQGIWTKFQEIMKDFQLQNCEKYIFDLRNNPGWFLDEALIMLDVFIPTKQPELIVISKDDEKTYLAEDTQQGEKIIDQKTILLINGWSASASEIFAWTLKDYNKNLKIIGEKSYGKGSVQRLIDYKDWSSLKYTIQKRYTGKTKTWIDKIGITPDIILEKQESRWDKDIILEVAKKLIR